jgi:hypothetical protein
MLTPNTCHAVDSFDPAEVQTADFGLTLLLWAVTFAISQMLMPKVEIENARPATLGDFKFPTATEGRVIPLSWGTDVVKGPNVIWYGNLRKFPIHERVQTSLFNTKRMIVGWAYYVGIQFGICHGPAVLKAIYVGDILVWSGTQATDGVINLNKGHLKGKFHFYTGSKTQAQNSYLATHQSPCPAYRGLCHGVWEGGYVGESTNIKPWSFVIERIPTGLGGGDHAVNGNADCGLMHMAYDIFTDTSWGYGYPPTDIDVTGWQAAASTLKAEGNGISYMLAQQKNATDVIKDIERQGDLRFRLDAATGKWKVTLIRDGYSKIGLKELNTGNVKEIVEFTRGSWDGTLNTIRIKYKRRENDYADGYAPAHDAANMKVQGRKVNGILEYVGVRDDALANKLAWREIRARSYPFAKARLKVDRTFWDVYVGEVLLLTWEFEDFSCDKMPFRIIKIDWGNPDSPEIMLDIVQDVFSWRAASFADSDGTDWTVPETGLIPFAAADQLAHEACYAVSRRSAPASAGRIWCAGESQGRGESGFEVLQRNNSGVPSGTYYNAAAVSSLIVTGTLSGNIDQDDVTIDVLTDLPLGEIKTFTDSDAGYYLGNWFMIGDELILCTGATEITGGLRLTGCLRGVCDTAQANHSNTDKVWFMHTGGEITTTVFDASYNVELKYLPHDISGNQVAESDVGITELDVDMDYRERRPYPPTFIDWNTSQYPATVDITSDVALAFNRRDYRIYNEYSQHHTDASTINGDFPANNNTKYQYRIYNGASIVYSSAWNAGAASLTVPLVKIFRYLNGLPTTLKLSVNTKHTYNSVDYESRYDVQHTATVQASSYDDDHWFGVCSPSTTCPNSWTAPQTGTYGFSIPTSIAGDVEARINGGGWAQIIPSGNTTGNLVGVTAADTVEVRHLDSSSSDERLLTVTAPSGTEDGFGVLVFA